MDKSVKCISASELSEQTGVSLSLIRKLTRKGEIPCLRIGRRIIYPITAIEAWLKAAKKVGGRNE